MLKEVTIRAKYRTLFHQWLEDFKRALENIADSQEYDVSVPCNSRFCKEISSLLRTYHHTMYKGHSGEVCCSLSEQVV
jgi:hypothetical protein